MKLITLKGALVHTQSYTLDETTSIGTALGTTNKHLLRVNFTPDDLYAYMVEFIPPIDWIGCFDLSNDWFHQYAIARVYELLLAGQFELANLYMKSANLNPAFPLR
jgi:hypothetical protein